MAEQILVGDRVRVAVEGVVEHVSSDGQSVFLVGELGSGRQWHLASNCTVLPPPAPVGPPGVAEPERSPTAIELRLRKLEQRCTALDELVSRESFGDRLRRLEQDVAQHSTTLTAFMFGDTAMARLERLERKVASIRSALNDLAEE